MEWAYSSRRHENHVVGTSVLIDDPVKRTIFEADASVSKVIDQQESFSNKTLYYTNGNIFSRMAQTQRNDALIAKGKVRYGFRKENSYLDNEAVVSYHKSDATAHLRQADFLTRPDETAWGAALDSIYGRGSTAVWRPCDKATRENGRWDIVLLSILSRL